MVPPEITAKVWLVELESTGQKKSPAFAGLLGYSFRNSSPDDFDEGKVYSTTSLIRTERDRVTGIYTGGETAWIHSAPAVGGGW